MRRGRVIYSLYIPDDCRLARQQIESGDLTGAAETLSREASFGRPNSCALLAYLHLRDIATGLDADRVLEKCSTTAAAGHAYSQFVLAWAYFKSESPVEACRWMKLSASQGFILALADVARFMVSGVGLPTADHVSARKMYRLALSKLHVPSAAYISRDLSEFGKNVGWRLIGRLMCPVTVLAMATMTYLKPFSLRSFAHVPNAKRPLFRSS